MPLTLESRAVIDAIDRRGSFAAAAGELHRVPSALTYQVRKLEDELGAALFDRRGHRATLTPAGRALVDAARPLLDDADALVQRVRRIATGWETTLRIAVAPTHPLATAPEPIRAHVVQQHRAVVAADTSRQLPARTVGLLDGQETLVVPDLDTKIAAQVASLGCGFVPAHLAHDAIASGRLVVRDVERDSLRSPGRMHLAWRGDRRGNAHDWWVAAILRSPLAEGLAVGGAPPTVTSSAEADRVQPFRRKAGAAKGRRTRSSPIESSRG